MYWARTEQAARTVPVQGPEFCRPSTYAFAQLLKHSQTAAETYFMQLIQAKNWDVDIMPQCVIGPYIVDFYCPQRRSVIELDGFVHDDPMRRDKDYARTEWLKQQGLRVIRFRNEHVFNRTSFVMRKTRNFLGCARIKA